MPENKDEIRQIINDKNKEYRLLPDSAQFEIGEEILIHLGQTAMNKPYMIDNPENFDLINPHSYPILAKYSKYQIHGDVAYNDRFPTGLSLDLAVNESQ